MARFPSSSLLLFAFSLAVLLFSRATDVTHFKGIDLGSPVLDVSPTFLSGHSSIRGSKDVILCDRVQVSGHSRLKLGSYASAFRVTLAPSVVIPERLHSKIQVCFHRNASLGLCECQNEEWRTVQNGLWYSIMSPYEVRYVDVKFAGDVSGSVIVSVEEDFHQWRLICLALGFVLMLLAPFVSSWVPFYYSSSMAIGVFLVVIILLFQGMKLLPTGRKNFFYLTIYGSVLGAGSFIMHHFSMMVSSILVSFGVSEEMHNPVAIFVVVGIILSGAALGYWIVRKFVISKDGGVDVGVAQFVKWVMRIIGSTFILQSTLDAPLAIGTLALSCALCSLINSTRRHGSSSGDGSPLLQRSRQANVKLGRAEFLSRYPRMDPKGNMYSPKTPRSWSNSPVKGVVSSPTQQQHYYSSFHKTRNQKKFTEQEWEDFTRESTRQAIAELAASPEFTDWIIDHADRIKLVPSEESSSDESVGSKLDSPEDAAEGSISRFRLLDW